MSKYTNKLPQTFFTEFNFPKNWAKKSFKMISNVKEWSTKNGKKKHNKSIISSVGIILLCYIIVRYFWANTEKLKRGVSQVAEASFSLLTNKQR